MFLNRLCLVYEEVKTGVRHVKIIYLCIIENHFFNYWTSVIFLIVPNPVIHTKCIEFQLYTVIFITAKNRCSALFMFYVTAWRADCIILQDDRCIALSHLPWCWRPRNYSVVKWSWWQIVWVRMDLLSVGRALLLAVTDWWAEASGKKQEGRLLLSGSLSTVSCLPPSCVSLCLFHTYRKTPPQHANRWLGARKSLCICVSERPRCQNTHIRHRQWQRHWNTSAGDDAMMDCLCQCQNIRISLVLIRCRPTLPTSDPP